MSEIGPNYERHQNRKYSLSASIDVIGIGEELPGVSIYEPKKTYKPCMCQINSVFV